MPANADYAGTLCDHLGRRWALGQCLLCGGDDTPLCDHPLDAVMWNPWNQVTQCHRCGKVLDRTPMPSDDAMHWEPWPRSDWGRREP